MTLLQQLHQDRATLQTILQAHTVPPAGHGVGLATIHAIYTTILSDAITTLDSMITHLETSPPLNTGEAVFGEGRGGANMETEP